MVASDLKITDILQQGSVGKYIQHQHPPFLLPLQVCPTSYEKRFDRPELRFCQPLHWAGRPS